MSPEMQPPPRPASLPRLLIGAFLVLMGVLLALDQFGFVEADHVMRLWPVLVILYGFTILQRGGRGVVFGSIVLLIGAWLLLNTLHLLSLEPWQFLWPLILVFVGARILMRGGAPRDRDVPPPGVPFGGGSGAGTGTGQTFIPPPNPSSSGGSPPVSDHLSMFGMMGGSKQRVSGTVFRSAEMTSFMGGCDLDLREALLGADGAAYIEVFSLMGGANIFVPPNWKVVMQVTPIMGSVEDKTRSIGGGAQFLYVRGTVLMGGVEISN
jgi:predicted membrane protein